ncbi:hypothetical protein M3Y99_00572900 [Aphelenchoides fujianensis]|nr:hypothetical protein M3Y99_00572900 [Aphelenchoides fujianensis]
MTEQSAIVQFPSAQVCGCPKCWKTADRPVRCDAHVQKNPSDHVAEDFVVVDSFTLVVLESYWNHLALYLIRFTATSDEYECRLLHRFPEGLTTVCIRLKLANGDVRHVILGMWLAITFTRLDLAEGALELDHTTELPFGDLISFAWSNDGRQLYSLQQWTERALHVYSVEQKKWTKEPQPEGGFAFELSRAPISCFSRTIYAHAPVPDGETTISPLFRFNLGQRKWERVAAEVQLLGDVHSIVNPADGEEDGVVVIEWAGGRFNIQRVKFRNPDSLTELALVAVRKLREGVQVEEVFRLVNGKAPSTFLPSVYEGMEPIPIRSLR